MRGHKPPTQGPQEVPSAPKLPLSGRETHGVVLMEGSVSVHPHKGSSRRFMTYRPEARGRSELGEGQSSIPGHKPAAGDRAGWQAPLTYKMIGRRLLTFLELNSK